MHDAVTELYYSQDPLCEEGRQFLADRMLSIPEAIKKGICSRDGKMYFMYLLNGEVVRWKARSMQDKKKQFMSKLDDASEETFKMPFFSHSKVPPLRYLVITEGEYDCVALSQLGCLNVVSLPNGAGSVETTFRNFYDFLQEFELIYIAFDMDKAGEEAAKKALSMISPTKYRRICFPCKDANEWIKQNPYLEFKDLQLLMENARKVDNPCLTHMNDLPQGYFDSISLGCSTGWNSLDRILGGARVGEVTVITADTGSGKSTFCIQFFKNLADQGNGIWINSYEMHPKITHRKLASIVLQKPMKLQAFSQEDIQNYQSWLRGKKVFLNTSNSRVDLDILRNLFEMASLAYGVNFILLDHLDYIHANGKKKTSLENIDDAVREIHTLAMQYNIGVLLVVHPKQKQDGKEITMHDLKGSAAIKQYADNIIILTRMDRLDPNDTRRVKIHVCKNRLRGIEKFFYLRYDDQIDGYIEGF